MCLECSFSITYASLAFCILSVERFVRHLSNCFSTMTVFSAFTSVSPLDTFLFACTNAEVFVRASYVFGNGCNYMPFDDQIKYSFLVTSLKEIWTNIMRKFHIKITYMKLAPYSSKCYPYSSSSGFQKRSRYNSTNSIELYDQIFCSSNYSHKNFKTLYFLIENSAPYPTKNRFIFA